jgi:phage recombination protein Bet
MATELVRMPTKHNLESRFAEKFEIDPAKVMSIVAATVFKQGNNESPLTPDEIQAAMIVCNEYDLNPFTKEIYAFRSKGKLLIYVSVDGWCKIINRQPELDGIEFSEQFSDKGAIISITCRIFRKDRRLPIVITEFFSECVRDTEPWKKSPIRMLRHKSLIQCGRVAFGISGIMDEDDAESIQGQPVPHGTPNGPLIDQSVGETPAPKITQDQAREFGKAWKASGFAMADAKGKLRELCGVEASLDIPADKYSDAMRWATKNPAWPNEMSPNEEKARQIFGILEYDLARQSEVIEAHTLNGVVQWGTMVISLSAEVNATE